MGFVYRFPETFEKCPFLPAQPPQWNLFSVYSIVTPELSSQHAINKAIFLLFDKI
jgi:hypothetical protein